MEASAGLAAASLSLSLNLMHSLVSRGLISPNEVETIYSAMIEHAATADPSFSELVERMIQTSFADMRETAKARWMGKGNPDPEPPSRREPPKN